MAAAQPYMIPAPVAAKRVADPLQEQIDELRDQLLLHCMPEERSQCDAAVKNRLRNWLRTRLADGAKCADLAAELTVPPAGIEPWCGVLSRQLDGSKRAAQ